MNKEDLLDADTVRAMFDYNPETGVFIRKTQARSYGPGAVAGCLKDGIRIAIAINKRQYMAHRLAWLHFYGVWPSKHIDHIDGDATNNRISNLRDVENMVNRQNIKSAFRNNKSTGVLGVSHARTPNKFIAHINHANEGHYLGTFDDKESAHEAYLDAKRKLHAGCTI